MSFLNATSYQEVIEANRKIAQEDYNRVIEELNPVYKALTELNQTLNTHSGEVETSVSRSEQDYLKPISEIYNRLRESRSMDIENLEAMVRAKKRTVAHFTIVMMGRTKAGKSTLFSTLLGTGYERIGTGQQRTTRKNCTYDIGNGIRLIDTPGIAAVGGEADEAEALKAVNEADLICYLVTNDSIQESEFNFFDKLKRQTKPLIILLNVQYNLEDEDLLEFFLDDPDEELTGQEIEDHKKRIFNYARKKYNNDSIVVIPVMLLAARLSRQKQDPELCKQLYEASRIQDFLKRIDDVIKNYGSLLTSQTIIGETSVLLTPPLLAIQNERKIC
ncbi:GTP-binding protein, partial [Geitlerinema sp. P-1104]|uniref:GTPase n=1 Tax=Geitlerinema sp. P-1104 TaxID=2546230 RepID=UPI001476C380